MSLHQITLFCMSAMLLAALYADCYEHRTNEGNKMSTHSSAYVTPSLHGQVAQWYQQFPSSKRKVSLENVNQNRPSFKSSKELEKLLKLNLEKQVKSLKALEKMLKLNLDTKKTYGDDEQLENAWKLKVHRDVGRGFLSDIIRGTLGLAGNATKRLLGGTVKALGWLTAKTIKIGETIIRAPVQGIELSINAAWAMHKFGVRLTAKILSDTADWFQGNWKAVKAMEFPGKHLIVMMYPSGLMSVVDRVTKEVMYMLDAAHRKIKYTFGYTLYLSLKVVFKAVSSAIHNCIKLSLFRKLPVKRFPLDTIYTNGGTFCGLTHLKPVNNVTITRSDKKFLIVSLPWVMDKLYIKLTGVKVEGMGQFGTLFKNETLGIKIKRIQAKGTVSFRAGTLLRFIHIRIEIVSFEGLAVKFYTDKKNTYMELIEGMSSSFGDIVKDEINKMLFKIEQRVFNYIAKIGLND